MNDFHMFTGSLFLYRYQDGGPLFDQLMDLLQYHQENIHFLSEEVWVDKESSDYFFCRNKVPAMFHCKESKAATRL
uniref:Uncharacterized protein n=1 Tax=Solanum lycopersicum TaxID=4081 RepID=A0A3Q7HBX8_SOLLC